MFLKCQKTWGTVLLQELSDGKISLRNVSREFDWDSSIQSLVVSSGGFIHFLAPMFTDALCRYMGSKRVMTTIISLSGVLTVLNPLAARISPYFLIVLRVLVGPCVGIVLALLTDLFSWWAPESEKVAMASLAYAGINVGEILVAGPTGYMCSIPIANGWPFIFYLHGAIAIVWCVVWHVCATERPEDHPFISEEEKTYIIRTRFAMEVNQEKTAPPYLSIARSKPVWGYLILMTAHASNIIIFASYLPKYISSAFQFSSEQVGLITSAIHVSRILGIVVFNFLSNSLFSRTHLAKITIRKVVQCSGFFCYTVPLLILGFLKNNIVSLTLLNIIMIGQCSPVVSAYILPLDMAPRYSGFLTAVCTSLTGVVVIPGLVVAGLMTPEQLFVTGCGSHPQGTLEEWRNVFIMLGASFTLGTVAFLLLGSSDLQPWATPPDNTDAEEKKRPVTFDL
ncbi:probable small intestine urate exporter isoform X1 [Pomacea canaliculata]|uniref:probable small intestine urate exporter isoform X1 n=1 Tax=Pomacea canaliculata TaxID=400727 RepID=UPI000D737811|nr:probable small intestine urate exporter isoform X1 [Pomacea canaliculata]